MIRFFDVVFSIIGLVVGLPVFFIIFVLGLLDTGSPIFKQERLGRNKEVFTLVKFRTMSRETASVASHLAGGEGITKLGGFLRRSKLDELPQLWNVFKGEMSLVGPRPNLLNQQDLIGHRTKCGVYTVRPGITGLAQISKVDMSEPAVLAKLDQKMICSMSVKKYFSYILLTLLGEGSGDAAVK